MPSTSAVSLRILFFILPFCFLISTVSITPHLDFTYLESSSGSATSSSDSWVESLHLRILSSIMYALDDFKIRSRNASEVCLVDQGEKSIGLRLASSCCAG
jgi:hypothetical protein